MLRSSDKLKHDGKDDVGLEKRKKTLRYKNDFDTI